MYVDYGEVPPCIHTRLVLSHVEDEEYQVLTPDLDSYVESLSPQNPDFVNLWIGIAGGGVPPDVNPAHVYGFAPMSPADMSTHMAAGRALAEAERRRRGLPLRRGGGAAEREAPDGRSVWVLAEYIPGSKIGKRVFPPENTPELDGWALIKLMDSSLKERPCLIRRLKEEDIPAFCEERIGLARQSEAQEGDDLASGEDVRTLEVTYGLNGERQRGFRESVKQLQQVEFPDFPLEPRTALEYVKAVSSIAESATAQHHMWVGASKVPEGDRSIHEDEVLARIIDAALCYDCLNISNLACIELACRRRQLIAEAHSLSPAAPNYTGAEHFMGQTYRAGGGVVVPTLTEHVSRQLQAQSQIMKEKRKMAEAKAAKGKGKEAPKGAPKGAGGGGQ